MANESWDSGIQFRADHIHSHWPNYGAGPFSPGVTMPIRVRIVCHPLSELGDLGIGAECA